MPQGAGKTSFLVRTMFDGRHDDVAYYAPSMSQARNAVRVAEELLGHPLATEELDRFRSPSLSRRPPSRLTRAFVDELDGFISGVGLPIELATITPTHLHHRNLH